MYVAQHAKMLELVSITSSVQVQTTDTTWHLIENASRPVQAVMEQEQSTSAEGYQALLASMKELNVDIGVSNWNQTNVTDMDFGTGPVAHPMAHTGLQPLLASCVVALPDGVGLRMITAEDRLENLLQSPTLLALAPSSELMKSIMCSK